jgi:uncharacterized membrane protein
VGFVLWVGAGLAVMFIGIAGRREERAALATVTRLQAALYTLLIGPGVVLTVVSGLALTFETMGSLDAPSGWLMLMQGAGMLSAAVVFFVGWPTARRLSRLSPLGETAPLFDALRRRQVMTGPIAGTLALLALLAGAMALQ